MDPSRLETTREDRVGTPPVTLREPDDERPKPAIGRLPFLGLVLRSACATVQDRRGLSRLATGSSAQPADFSPDDRWLVYNSEEAVVYETLVRSFPDGDRIYSIQAEGGVEAVWVESGELFYRLGDRFYVTQTKTDGTFQWTEPELAFEIPFLDTPGRSYAVTSDGQRLYTIVQAEDDIVDRIHVIGGLAR